MDTELEEFEFTKRMAFFISHLRHELRGKKESLSDKDITELLNTQGVPNHDVAKNRVNQICRALWLIPSLQHAGWLAALDSIFKKNNIQIDIKDEVPSVLEERYARDLSPAYRQASGLQQGDALGEMAATLKGLWHFFYLSPIDRDGNFKPEIRGTAAIFERAGAESHSVRLRLLSRNGFWKGVAFVNDSHLYLSCTAEGRIETAFFVTNRPDRRTFTIAGTGAALERHKKQGKMPAAAGFVCFGVKWSAKNKYFSANNPAQASLVESFLIEFENGQKVSDSAQKALRDIFCVKLTLKEIEKRYPELYKHVSDLEINGKPGLSSERWIYVDSGGPA